MGHEVHGNKFLTKYQDLKYHRRYDNGDRPAFQDKEAVGQPARRTIGMVGPISLFPSRSLWHG